jgi:hypothetical protein
MTSENCHPFLDSLIGWVDFTSADTLQEVSKIHSRAPSPTCALQHKFHRKEFHNYKLSYPYKQYHDLKKDVSLGLQTLNFQVVGCVGSMTYFCWINAHMFWLNHRFWCLNCLAVVKSFFLILKFLSFKSPMVVGELPHSHSGPFSALKVFTGPVREPRPGQPK